ncbi:FeMo cofactor biosynthesis protein (plasmid) [Rhizobium grahamii CCGE 502]|uniref:FeMo cofactor biosynthesis protein n=1 Tax=Rhizobium grahamii CCGE 502 TaxID=990285 RepID=S3H641_9HYPH|nr:FeMo cofactor biosynthesis protein [Rhizobium grahamii CCGE 502]
MLSLEMLAERGILTKINSAMIPGVNSRHLIEVNRWVKEHGAFLHNIMPLIFGSSTRQFFGLTGRRSSTPRDLKALQDRLDDGATRTSMPLTNRGSNTLKLPLAQSTRLKQVPDTRGFRPFKQERSG